MKPLKLIVVCYGLWAGVLTTAAGQSCVGLVGGIELINNGDVCANSATVPAKIRISAGDVDDTNDPSLIQFSINWDDGSAAQVVSSTANGWQGSETHSYMFDADHLFPASGTNVKCVYHPSVTVIVNSVVCSTVGTPPAIERWNTDDQPQGGALNLSEVATEATDFQVFEGISTDVIFLDRSVLNCLTNFSPQLPNQYTRSRQYVYGTGGSNVIGVTVDGTVQTYPFSGEVMNTPATGVTTPPTQLNTLTVTIPATASTGQFFEITLNEWDYCNPYPGTPITTTARISVVVNTITGDLATPNKGVSVYPNPCHDFLMLGGVTSEVSESVLTDLMGRSSTLKFDKQSGSLRADVGFLPAGIFILNFADGIEVHHVKFIKQ